MEDPFKVGLKAFFGVATGVGILIFTFYLFQSLDFQFKNFKENQERKEKRERVEKEREKERKKRLSDLKSGKAYRPSWMEEKIKGCLEYPTKKQRDYCINVYSPNEK